MTRRPFAKVADIQAYVNGASGRIDVVMRRGKRTFASSLLPVSDPSSGKKLMGVGLAESVTVSFPWYLAIWHGIAATGLAGRVIAEAIRGQSSRLDAFARIPHLPFPGGRLLRTPMLVAAMAWYKLRDAMW